ncbi:Transcriptional activator spt7 [Puccinia graminis f. sp. tritici]|uniref:Transcriptional activator spt7 n=1 Tax=Puccinia graminis f. sp. tritici TaxID=56615 RepID=A0A5B0P8Y1_PUCGR|nr:Transcriptional activator spt7 [Puccinia graminis f. sp. tritici]
MKFLLELIQSQSHDASELVALRSDARGSGLRDEKATQYMSSSIPWNRLLLNSDLIPMQLLS